MCKNTNYWNLNRMKSFPLGMNSYPYGINVFSYEYLYTHILPALAGEPKRHFSWVMKGANKKFIHKGCLQREDFTGGSCICQKVSSQLATITGNDCQQ